MQFTKLKKSIKNWSKTNPKKFTFFLILLLVGIINLIITVTTILYKNGIQKGINIANSSSRGEEWIDSCISDVARGEYNLDKAFEDNDEGARRFCLELSTIMNSKHKKNFNVQTKKDPVTSGLSHISNSKLSGHSAENNYSKKSISNHHQLSNWKISDFSKKPDPRQLARINSIILNEKIRSLVDEKFSKKIKGKYTLNDSRMWVELSEAISNTIGEKKILREIELYKTNIQPKWNIEQEKKLFLIALALKWAAAHTGDISSMHKLALELRSADQYQLINDYSTSMMYLEQAAKKGHAPSQSTLGLLLLNGKSGVMMNKDKGLNWLELAAKKNDLHSICELGILHFNGTKGLDIDQKKGISLFKKALLQPTLKNNSSIWKCVKYLREAYREGKGFKKSCEKSLAIGAIFGTSATYTREIENLHEDELDHRLFFDRQERISHIHEVYRGIINQDVCEINQGKNLKKWSQKNVTTLTPSKEVSNCINQVKPKMPECPKDFEPTLSCNQKRYPFPVSLVKNRDEYSLEKRNTILKLLSDIYNINSYSWKALCYLKEDPDLAYSPKSKYNYELKTNLPSHVISNIKKLSKIRKK